MIVQERSDSYLLIKQHDHGLLSGEFAWYWAREPRPFGSTLYAIANHDVGWQKLDETVLWDEASGKPYSFTSYPREPKLQAYEEGLNLLEEQSAYAACLCSMHYASFVRGSENTAEVRFREREARRQEKLKGTFSTEELKNLGHNFRFLQLCDDLSLFVCLNRPGHNDHPWYKNGFDFEGTKFEPLWEDNRTLRLDPNPFSESFDLAVPCKVVEKDGRLCEGGYLEFRVSF